MAVPPLRRRVGMNEIKEKERKAREELRKRQKEGKVEDVSKEEHEQRLNLLKEIGVLK